MQSGEFACPKCAETIKVAATVCRYCGLKFTKKDAENRVAIDSFIDERMDRRGEITTLDLSSTTHSREYDEDGKLRVDFLNNVGLDKVEQRLQERGIEILEPRRHVDNLDIQEIESLDDELRFARDWDKVQDILRRRRVDLRSGRLRWKDLSGSSSSSRGLGAQVDTQYGVLQPAANLAGGCVNVWMILAVIFAILIAVTALSGGLS